MVTVSIDYGGFPKGTMVAVEGLGQIPNLTPVVLSAEQVELFENKTGIDIEDYYRTSPQVEITSTKEKQLKIEAKTNKEVTK